MERSAEDERKLGQSAEQETAFASGNMDNKAAADCESERINRQPRNRMLIALLLITFLMAAVALALSCYILTLNNKSSCECAAVGKSISDPSGFLNEKISEHNQTLISIIKWLNRINSSLTETEQSVNYSISQLANSLKSSTSELNLNQSLELVSNSVRQVLNAVEANQSVIYQSISDISNALKASNGEMNHSLEIIGLESNKSLIQSVKLINASLANVLHQVGRLNLSIVETNNEVSQSAVQFSAMNQSLLRISDSVSLLNQSVAQIDLSLSQSVSQFANTSEATNRSLDRVIDSLTRLDQSIAELNSSVFAELTESNTKSGQLNRSLLHVSDLVQRLDLSVTESNQTVTEFTQMFNRRLAGLPVLPVGTIAIYTSDSAPPSRWLFCNGQAVSRTVYRDLFAVIGTAYGQGDYTSTFNLPDLRGRVVIGVDASQINVPNATMVGVEGGKASHKLTVDQLPAHDHDTGTLSVSSAGSHNHQVNDPGHNHGGFTGNAVGGFYSSNGVRVEKNTLNAYSTTFHQHTIPSGITGITIAFNGLHSHQLTGRTAVTGINQELPILPPYQAQNYIIYAG